MATDKEFGQELLKVNGIETDGLSSEDRRALHKILALERARARRMKWAMVVAIILLVAFGVTTAVMEEGLKRSPVHGIMVGITAILFYMTLWFVVSYSIRASFVRNRENQVRIAEIECRMASIDERLRRMSEGR